ncbi:MAG: FAD-dependent oxidoreductase [Oligoflexia bacterium]|nr:FAD-dependent oxidoreductase [Oligoflexia bacterium]
MKIAIIGGSPLGIEVAMTVANLGGHPILFHPKDKPAGIIQRLEALSPELALGSWQELTSEIGRQQAKLEKQLSELATVSEYLHHYLIPLHQALTESGVIKKSNVHQVSKRFLAREEEIEGRSRFLDLFRVLYHRDPQESIESQKEMNPEIFEQLGEGIIESLKKGVEAFEDFDVVLDTRAFASESQKMGPGGAYALNEYFLRENEKIIYGKDILEKVEEIKSHKRVALVGDGFNNALLLHSLADWMREKGNTLNLICSSAEPFAQIKEQNTFLYEQVVEPCLSYINEDFQNDCRLFEKKMMEWRAMPEHERNKLGKPVEPVPRLKVFTGFEVTSLDSLMDRDGLFLTLETPEFRHLGREIMMTVGVDIIAVDKGHVEKDDVLTSMNVEEKGLIKENFKSLDFNQVNKKSDLVIELLNQLFTKVED